MLARVMVQSVRFLALVLGSWHSLVLLPLMVPVLAVRCTLEERMLLAGLESDTEYVTRVRYRLRPGV